MMFDRTILSLKKGTKFKASVNYCNLGSFLYRQGLRDNQVVKCEMLDDTDTEPDVLISIDGSEVIMNSQDDYNDFSLKFKT